MHPSHAPSQRGEGARTGGCRHPVGVVLADRSGPAVEGTPRREGTYTAELTTFNNQTGSTIPIATQVVGVQWQVNSGNSGTGTCTVELRIDDVTFR